MAKPTKEQYDALIAAGLTPEDIEERSTGASAERVPAAAGSVTEALPPPLRRLAARPSLGGSLMAVPGRVAEMASAGFQGPASMGSADLLRRTVEDLFAAKAGDQEAANRVAAREMAAGLGTAVLPGGPLVGGLRAAGTRAALGGATAGIEAAASGQPERVPQAALMGGSLAAVLPPALARPIAEVAERARTLMSPAVRGAVVEAIPAGKRIAGIPGAMGRELERQRLGIEPLGANIRLVPPLAGVPPLQALARMSERAVEPVPAAAEATARTVGRGARRRAAKATGKPATPGVSRGALERHRQRPTAGGASRPEIERRTTARASATGKAPPADAAQDLEAALRASGNLEAEMTSRGLTAAEKAYVRSWIARGMQ